MPIPLTQPTIPSLKLPQIGSGAELAVIGTRRRPWTEFGTGAQKLGNDGKPREQLVVTGVVVSQQNAIVGDNGVDRPVQVGEIVTMWLHSHQWWSWIEAQRAHGAMNVGDIALWFYSHDEPSSQGGNNPKKVRSIKLRRPTTQEAQFVQQAERAFYEMGFDKPDQGPPQQQPGPFDQDSQGPPQQPAYGQQQPAPAYGQQQMGYGQQAPAQQGYGQSQPQPQPDYGSPSYDPGF